MIILSNMQEKEPKIEYEPSYEKPEKSSDSENREIPEREIPEKGIEEIKKKREEEEEKEEAYKDELDELVETFKEKGFSEANKKAKKMSKKKGGAVIIDRFHDKVSQIIEKEDV